MSTTNTELIYKQALNLPHYEQLKLISKLTTSIKLAKANKKHKLSELRGLGKELWKNIDSDKYIKNLREEWDER